MLTTTIYVVSCFRNFIKVRLRPYFVISLKKATLNVSRILNCEMNWVCLSALHQDFADLAAQPCLELPSGSGLEREEKNLEEESSQSGVLSPDAINTLVKVHQHLCLGYAQSLWYCSTAPATDGKEHMAALVSSCQIASPLMSSFYHLIGQWWFRLSSVLSDGLIFWQTVGLTRLWC